MKTILAIIFTASLSFGGDLIRITDQATVIPAKIGNVDNPGAETLRLFGWRVMPDRPAVSNGYTRISITAVEGDGTNGVWSVVDRLTAEIEAEQAAADLAANGARYVLENQYIILCDVLRTALGQTNTQAKLGFEELPVMMMMLKAGSKDAYETLRDAMDMVNAALIRYDVRWWDNAVWHPQPELAEKSNSILGLVQ